MPIVLSNLTEGSDKIVYLSKEEEHLKSRLIKTGFFSNVMETSDENVVANCFKAGTLAIPWQVIHVLLESYCDHGTVCELIDTCAVALGVETGLPIKKAQKAAVKHIAALCALLEVAGHELPFSKDDFGRLDEDVSDTEEEQEGSDPPP